MKIDEMVAVIQHYRDGGEVEFKRKDIEDDVWTYNKELTWNFNDCDYRIKEKPKTKVVWFWKIRFGNRWITTGDMCTEDGIKETYPDALEYKRLDILGSEEVQND